MPTTKENLSHILVSSVARNTTKDVNAKLAALWVWKADGCSLFIRNEMFVQGMYWLSSDFNSMVFGRRPSMISAHCNS